MALDPDGERRWSKPLKESTQQDGGRTAKVRSLWGNGCLRVQLQLPQRGQLGFSLWQPGRKPGWGETGPQRKAAIP